MAGHSKFKNIMHRKGSQDVKRSQVFTRIAREISVAVKEGKSNNIDSNSRLRNAIEDAKKANMPKSKIDHAMNKINEYDNLTHCVYYAYSPEKIPLVIECLTGNVNKAASEIKAAINKNSGIFSSSSLEFLFDKVGLLVYNVESSDANNDNSDNNDNANNALCTKQLFEEEIFNSDILDYELYNDCYYITLSTNNYIQVKESIKKGILTEHFAHAYIVKNTMKLQDHDKFNDFCNKINEVDDVLKIWTGIKYFAV